MCNEMLCTTIKKFWFLLSDSALKQENLFYQAKAIALVGIKEFEMENYQDGIL